MKINKLIGNGEYGLFYTSHDSKNINFSALNVTLNGLYQLSERESTFFYIETKNNFKNVHLCNLQNNCRNRYYEEDLINSEIFYGLNTNVIIINNSVFDNIYGDKGLSGGTSYIVFRNSTLKNSYFRNGFIFMNEGYGSSGKYYITNSVFTNNTSEFGTVVNIIYMDEKTGCEVNSTNSYYIGNRATKYGGVFYSMGPYNNLHVNIKNNTFIDNHAKLGDIMYSYSRAAMPNIDNIEELEAIDGAIVTNPTQFILDEDSIKKISIYSGDTIPNNISSNKKNID
ncbi:hypothetical protein PIROE2DRAFT_17101 [Piromyces sp. E2]|nr:hypothetical protein PIROE2DRAFT_17101 [Piromyces sp. E2]|eukprot:OUM57802.1 hypothetical protein PIROE2DRAFT_17101 [Piromyces sp. E2]